MIVMTGVSQRARRKGWWVLWSAMAVVLVAAIVIILNHDWINDWYRGVSYEPSDEMAKIRDELDLTGQGVFLYNAAQPVLNEAMEFNENCRKDESETAVLGCYADGNIYIYNIVAPELDGIRELTTAHELLHAKWARMSDDEKIALVESLTRVFEANQDFLDEEINQYDISEKQEELYVRAGTEVKDLPEKLEEHFAEIFENQDAVVDFYDKYIAVFRKKKSEMEALMQAMQDIQAEIASKTATYEAQYAQLEADIASFNSCAAVAGCFGSEGEFYLRRTGLVARQNELNMLNEEINGLVDVYNEKVELYNSDVTETHKLHDMINSNSRMEEL